MFAASPLAQDCINLVNEDDAGLQLACQTEDGVDQLITVSVPLLCEGRDVEVDEASPRLVCKSLCQHGLSATGRPVQQHAAGSAQQRRRVGVEMRHGQRVDDGFLELLDDRVETADVVKGDWDFFGRDDLHGDGLLVAAQHQILHARPAVVLVLVVVAVVLAIALAPFAAQDGVEFARCGGGFGTRLLLLLGVRVESCEQVADDKVGDQWLGRVVSMGGTARGTREWERTAAAAIRMSGR